jgi:PAS domain S-box-containing protein
MMRMRKKRGGAELPPRPPRRSLLSPREDDARKICGRPHGRASSETRRPGKAVRGWNLDSLGRKPDSMELTKEQLQLLVECAPEPTVVYLVRSETSAPIPFLYSSDVPAFSGLSEKEYLELYRDDAEKAVLPQDLPTLNNMLRRIFRDKIAGACTYRTYHKTMGAIWTHAAMKWIGQYEGREVLLGTFSDISNQVAEDTPGGFFIYSAQEDDQFFFVGENMLKMLGYTREEFEKKFQNRFRFMVYEKDREATLKSITEQIAVNGRYDKVDYRIEKRDKSIIWVHDEGHYVVDKDNRPWFYVTINDMSELVEEQDKLRKENARLGAIIRSIPVGLSVFRLDQNQIELAAVNDVVGEILEVGPEQMKEHHKELFTQHVQPDDLAGLSRIMREIRQEGRHKSAPFRYRARNQSWKWLRMEAETVAMPDGSVLVYNVLTDLTAEKHAEEELERTHRIQQEQYRASLQALLFANPQSLCTVRLNLSKNRCEEWYGTSQYVIQTIKADTADGVIDNISGIIVNETGPRKIPHALRTLRAARYIPKRQKERDRAVSQNSRGRHVHLGQNRCKHGGKSGNARDRGRSLLGKHQRSGLKRRDHPEELRRGLRLYRHAPPAGSNVSVPVSGQSDTAELQGAV